MKPIATPSTVIVVALAGVLLATTALADPPSRVARLNYVKGSVSFRPATLDDWGPATLNHPLTTGDHLWTDGDAWTEMHVGSTAIRMAPRTAFAFLNLDDRLVQVRLSEGAVDVRLRHLNGDFEINTPSAAIVLNRPGTYRIEVQPDEGSTRVIVRAGEALVYADASPFSVYDGQAASLYGIDQVAHEVYPAGPADEWERWCRARDEREDRVASLQYVSPGMTGYEDLDEYGTWTSVPEYGWAWQPRYVSAGWAPYRHGHWRWIEPWGWTWIDDAPWGFAPFHYGRWAHHHGRWLWVPGAYHAHPVYAPALVAFIGGDRWGVSFGFGFRNALAWFPLAPGEFWMPHYRASHVHIRNLNVTHVNVRNINITNYNVSHGTYVNRAIAGAVTAVPRDTFIGGRAVPRSAFAVDRTAAMRSEVIATSAPVAPRAESVLPRSGSVARPTSATLRRAVVARNEPPGPQVPFQARERALQASNGRPLDENTLAGLRGTAGARASESNSPVRLAGARAPRRGDPAGDRADPDAFTEGVTPRASSPGERGAGLAAVPRGGDRVRTGEPNARPGSAASGPESQPNDRPAWARPRGGTAATNPGSYGSGAPSVGGEAAGRAGARARSGEDPRAAAPADRGAANDRPATASPGAVGRGTRSDRP
ncbi:MAG TPA: DUF6600 domain-containing protein, partial [Vicinamibacterales bacterium]|nr:DUF6600 domain-containing protein [Vicinamibacterales bacterium]